MKKGFFVLLFMALFALTDGVSITSIPNMPNVLQVDQMGTPVEAVYFTQVPFFEPGLPAPVVSAATVLLFLSSFLLFMVLWESTGIRDKVFPRLIYSVLPQIMSQSTKSELLRMYRAEDKDGTDFANYHGTSPNFKGKRTKSVWLKSDAHDANLLTVAV